MKIETNKTIFGTFIPARMQMQRVSQFFLIHFFDIASIFIHHNFDIQGQPDFYSVNMHRLKKKIKKSGSYHEVRTLMVDDEALQSGNGNYGCQQICENGQTDMDFF